MIYGPLIVISIVFAGIGWLMSSKLKSVFAKYARVGTASGMTGADVARQMLRDNGLTDVRILASPGRLSDHYNPADKTVNLSPEVYGGRSVSAAAVAAHECGHAVQHATAYSMLTLRSKLVPVVSFSAKVQQYLFMLGFVMIGSLGSDLFLMIAIGAFAVTALFSVVTLPVEFDASRRALAWLETSGSTVGIEHDGAQTTLKWAAMTYVVAALGSIVALLYWVSLLMGGRD